MGEEVTTSGCPLTSTLVLWHAYTQQTPNKRRKKLRQLKNSLKHVPENQPNTMFVFIATLLYTTLDLTERCSHHLYLEKRSLWFMDLGKSLYN